MKCLLKAALFLCVFTFSFTDLYSQDNEKKAESNDFNNDWCFKRDKPLTIFAYRRMMRDHYNFTIMGSQTPVSGFKIETNKPTITLKGNITSPRTEKDLVVNIELTGGLQNDLMQVFSGHEVSGYFKGSVGFNKMFVRGNKAEYLIKDDLLEEMLNKKVCMFREEIARQVDTFLILSSLETFVQPGLSNPQLADFITVISNRARQQEFRISKWIRLYPNGDARKYYEKMVVNVFRHYGADSDTANLQNWFVKFINDYNNNSSTSFKFAKLVDDYKRFVKFKEDDRHKYGLIDAYEIETYKDVWTSKRISWINVSLAATNGTFKLYNPAVLIEKITDGSSFLPSVSVTYNYFWKAAVANKYFFIRSGITGKRVNTLVDQSRFEYNKETVIHVTPTESLKSKKTGTAYVGAFAHGFGFEIPVEIYWAPWTQAAVPGLYTKIMYNYGDVWVNKNKIGADLGLVWNVLNNDKDAKNVLTIVPYMSWSNLLTEYKEIEKINKKERGDLFSVGVKFGIPVNLGR